MIGLCFSVAHALMWHQHSVRMLISCGNVHTKISTHSCVSHFVLMGSTSPQLLQRWTNDSKCDTVNHPIKMQQSGMSVCAVSLSLFLSGPRACMLPVAVHACICLCSYKCACEWENKANHVNLVGEGFLVKAVPEWPLKEKGEEGERRSSTVHLRMKI